MSSKPTQKFGTFLGVYVPSLLTILGLIMYLRFGWVVGNMGILFTVFIVLLSSSITFITALSASAIATNMRVGAGGEYFMVSRSLGLEMGGAIGIPLFLCRTLSITFYSFGLAEVVAMLWPGWEQLPGYSLQLLTVGIIALTVAVSGRSAAIALKLQIPILGAVGLSLLALAAGVFGTELRTPEVEATYRTAPEGFWYVFAVFFPAVTGFTAGIGMSGDLKDPQRSIPRGTLLAVVSGTLIYLLIPLVLSVSGKVSPDQLANPGVASWTGNAFGGPWLIFPGIMGAILSSAFGSALGGPRVLQSLAKDGLAPSFLARLSKTGQPTIATWVSGLIAIIAVGLGGLNAVAQFVTILFLTLYVVINFSSAIEKLVSDPSFRPTIRVPWYVALLGSAGAIGMMILINPWACAIAIILEFLIYSFIRRRSLRRRWGDVRAGMWLVLARFALLRLKNVRQTERNWRPNILVFAGDTKKRIGLVRLASWFNQDRGIVTVSRMIVGNLAKKPVDVTELQKGMEKDLAKAKLTAFTEVAVVSDFEDGIVNVTQANGIAGLHSNTIMFGWSDKRKRLVSQLKTIRTISQLGKSMIIAHIDHDKIYQALAREPYRKKRIDLWWGGKQKNGDLMLLLAYLLSLNPEWKNSQIYVRSIVEKASQKKRMVENLAKLLQDTRIPGVSDTIVHASDQSFPETIRSLSGDADLVFVGLKVPEPGTEKEYARWLSQLAEGMSNIIFVRNGSEYAGRLV